MEELREALRDCYDKSCKSFKLGDVKGVTKYYTQDCTMIYPGFKLRRGMKALTEMVQTLMDSPLPKNFAFVTDELVMMSEDIAYERGHFTQTYDDGTLFNRGKTLIVWKKVGGEWLVEKDSFNYDSMPDHYLNKK